MEPPVAGMHVVIDSCASDSGLMRDSIKDNDYKNMVQRENCGELAAVGIQPQSSCLFICGVVWV